MLNSTALTLHQNKKEIGDHCCIVIQNNFEIHDQLSSGTINEAVRECYTELTKNKQIIHVQENRKYSNK